MNPGFRGSESRGRGGKAWAGLVHRGLGAGGWGAAGIALSLRPAGAAPRGLDRQWHRQTGLSRAAVRASPTLPSTFRAPSSQVFDTTRVLCLCGCAHWPSAQVSSTPLLNWCQTPRPEPSVAPCHQEERPWVVLQSLCHAQLGRYPAVWKKSLEGWACLSLTSSVVMQRTPRSRPPSLHSEPLLGASTEPLPGLFSIFSTSLSGPSFPGVQSKAPSCCRLSSKISHSHCSGR